MPRCKTCFEALMVCVLAFFIAACSSSESTKPTEKDTTAPYVIDSYPDSGEVNVSRSGPFWIAFSEPMEKSMAGSCILFNPTVPNAEFSWKEDTLVITPAALLGAGTSYTITVDGSWEDLNGNPMGQDKVIPFTTTNEADNTRPEVVSTNPANGATGVLGTLPIEIVWSEPMNRWSTENAISIDPEPTDWWVEWESVNMRIMHTAFPANTTVRVTIGGGAQDLAGNHIAAPYSFSFTIKNDNVRPYLASANPSKNATGVPLNLSQIILTFSEPMDPNSFDLEPSNIDARIIQAVRVSPSWNSDYSVLTVPINRTLLPGCNYWVWFWNVTDASGNLIDPSPTIYEFTTTGDATAYPVNNGYTWNYALSWSGTAVRTIENYSQTSGNFDEVMRDGYGVIHEVTHLRKSGSTIYHRGRSEYDNDGNLEFTMIWEDPIPYIKLPFESHLGESWNFSTRATISATQYFELSGTVTIEPAKVNLLSEAFEATFRGCYKHHLEVDFTMYENGIPVDSGSMHQTMWISPCVGPVQIVSQDGGGSDTLWIYDWNL